MHRTQNPNIRRLRAKQMIMMRVNGYTNAQIATSLNIATKTVTKELTWADKQGLIQQAEDQIIQDLVPLAIKTMKEAMQTAGVPMKDRLKAADRVLSGTGVLKKEVEQVVPQGPVDEVEIWMMKRGRKQDELQATNPAQLTAGQPAAIAEEFVDAELAPPSGDDDEQDAVEAPQGPPATEQR